MTLLLVAIGGAAGAVARYLVDSWVVHRGLHQVPLGTALVNVTGSFGLGLLAGLLGAAGDPDWIAAFVGFGFLGAYTTFSTWMFEAARLLQRGAHRAAVSTLVGSLAAGVLAASAGVGLASVLLR